MSKSKLRVKSACQSRSPRQHKYNAAAIAKSEKNNEF